MDLWFHGVGEWPGDVSDPVQDLPIARGLGAAWLAACLAQHRLQSVDRDSFDLGAIVAKTGLPAE